MKVDTEVREQKEQREEESRPKEPKFEDIESSYMFWRNFLPETPYQEFIAIRKCVSIGKILLPGTGDKAIEALKTRIISKLAGAVPGKRTITFESQDIAGKKYPLYTIKGDGAGDVQAEAERLNDIRMDFKNQQYEYIVGSLQGLDHEIYQVLKDKKVIPIEMINPKKIIDATLREGGFDKLFEEDIPIPEKEAKNKTKEK